MFRHFNGRTMKVSLSVLAASLAVTGCLYAKDHFFPQKPEIDPGVATWNAHSLAPR